MKKKTPWSPRNTLLNELPPDACERLSDELQLVEIPAGKVLFEPYAPQTTLYFPREGIVSATLVLENGDSSAVAMVGNEGAVGLALLTDGRCSPSRYVVQAGGEALALRGDVAMAEFRRGGAFQRIMLRFMQAFQAQIAQTGVCNQHHTVEKQLTRWLLQVHDRVGSAEIRMTQEQIAHLLGVRREGVTEAARKLQEDGCIRYSRGLIQVLEREGMADRACECYAVVRREYDRLLSPADT